jgi:hypothetical protein
MTISVIGDIHGCYDKLTRVLQSAELVSEELNWIGGESTLWFTGDFFDRGPHGIHTLNLVMKLQQQAASVRGAVNALLGNHEFSLLAAYRFGHQRSTTPGGTFINDWKRNGGIEADLAALTPDHVEWLMHLPLMAHVEGRLFAHADALAYTRYGLSVEEVTATIQNILRSDDTAAWDQLMKDFSEHDAFADYRADGVGRAVGFLNVYGGTHLVHGHSPINKIKHTRAESITHALVYANGQCVNVDGGMYLGGAGFVYELDMVEERLVTPATTVYL